jgi:hypothetical protein
VLKRAAIVMAGVVACWLVVLFILGYPLGSRQERQTKERLGESLLAQVTVGDSELSLIRGMWTLDQLTVKRDDEVGHLALRVANVWCDLPPLGWALFDRTCSELAVRGVRLEVSTMQLFKVKRPKRKALRADRVVIDDATFAFLPSAFAPNLGGISITIEHAESGATLLRTPLSWLFTLEELRAKLELPAGVKLSLGYRAGVLTVAGSLFGPTPVEVPVQMPVPDPTADPHEETKQLVQVAKDIGERLVAKRAMDWVETGSSRNCGSNARAADHVTIVITSAINPPAPSSMTRYTGQFGRSSVSNVTPSGASSRILSRASLAEIPRACCSRRYKCAAWARASRRMKIATTNGAIAQPTDTIAITVSPACQDSPAVTSQTSVTITANAMTSPS